MMDALPVGAWIAMIVIVGFVVFWTWACWTSPD
jgi:hypothetical protein